MIATKTTKMTFAMCLTMLMGVSQVAAASEISIDTEYWSPSITNNSEVRTSNSSINLKNDLGVDKKSVLNFGASFKREKSDPHIFYIKNEGAEINGSRVLNRSVQFNGATYGAGDKVDSSIKFKHFQIGMKNEVVSAGGKFTTNYQLNSGKLTTRMNDLTKGFARANDKSFNSVGIGFGWESLGDTRWFAEITPLSIGSGAFTEYGFGIKTKLGQSQMLTIGYKAERIQVGKNNDADRTKLDMRGVYLNLKSNF